ncbi:hypothetical protein OCI51_25725 (plasmid) [Lysinibacillus capsici]|uniref:S16 family serine protease n=1 Tax=Lysinibacillus capsici TaxID=2115968 RepID=UPI0021D94277|nr:S16 family serine protease [Lysinibacillus capsici]UYB49964.1 hypothetical protein OCI51_25725 [Lysinibacillus capsici]
MVVLYFESPLLKYENIDYSITFYHPTEVLNDTNISILAVGTMKLNESEQVNLDNQIILNQVEITNIERYLSNNRGLFFDYFGGNSFRESLINVEHLIGRKTKSIEQMAIKQNVNGDSAGLAMTLSSMIELDLVSNNIPIAITGSIDIEGNVKAVGAVSEKVQIAVMDGFKYLIVPTANYDEAKETLEKLNEKLSIIPVKSVTEAKIAIEEINYQ